MLFSLLALAALPAALGAAMLFDTSDADETDTETEDDLTPPETAGDGGDLLSMALEAPVAEPVEGTTGDDTLIGSDGAEQIAGGRGDDRIDGFAGGDTLRGGSGADSLITGWDGADSLYGNAGDDILINDAASGSLLDGGSGEDLIDSAGGAANTLIGGAGEDTVFLGSAYANDAVQPGAVVDLGTGADTFYGIGGATIDSGTTDDAAAGDGPSDLIHLSLGNDQTTVIENFERGVDRLELTGFDGAALRYDAQSLTTEGEDLHLTYEDERIVTLSGLGDATLGDLFPEAQEGGILGGLGDDTIDLAAHGILAETGWWGNLAEGGAGDDQLTASLTGFDTLKGGPGDDTLTSGAGATGDITGDPEAGASYLDGGAGNGTLIGSLGDTMTGGSGEDLFSLGVNGLEPIVITDFTPGEDVLQLSAEYGELEGVTGFTQEVLADGSGLKITVSGWSNTTPILLQGVTAPLDAISFPQAFATADA